MILPAIGIGVAGAATGMAAMSGSAVAGPLGLLLQIGPWLLVASILLVTTGCALSSRPATVPAALLAGVVLYAGMYAQPDLTIMYLSIAVGYAFWLAVFVWLRQVDTPGRRVREPAPTDANW